MYAKFDVDSSSHFSLKSANITGGAFAQLCVNSNWLSQWEALGTRYF